MTKPNKQTNNKKTDWYFLRFIVFAKASRSFMPIVDAATLLRVWVDLKRFSFFECSLFRILSLCLHVDGRSRKSKKRRKSIKHTYSLENAWVIQPNVRTRWNFLLKKTMEKLTFRRKLMNLYLFDWAVCLCDSKSQHVDRCLDLLRMIQVYRIFHIIYESKVVDSCSMAEILKHGIWKMTKRRKAKCKQSCIETGFRKTIHTLMGLNSLFFTQQLEKNEFYFWFSVFLFLQLHFSAIHLDSWNKANAKKIPMNSSTCDGCQNSKCPLTMHCTLRVWMHIIQFNCNFKLKKTDCTVYWNAPNIRTKSWKDELKLGQVHEIL